MNWLFGRSSPVKNDASLPESAETLKDKLDITYITPRLLIIGALWEARTMKEERKNNSKEMATFLNEKHGGKYIIWNFDSKLDEKIVNSWGLFGSKQMPRIRLLQHAINRYLLDLYKNSYCSYIFKYYLCYRKPSCQHNSRKPC
jgi:hypothetical protein